LFACTEAASPRAATDPKHLRGTTKHHRAWQFTPEVLQTGTRGISVVTSGYRPATGKGGDDKILAKTLNGTTLLPSMLALRTIWIFWAQGWDQAPRVSKMCAESWRLYNPTWEVRTVSNKDLPKLLGNEYDAYQGRQDHLGMAHDADLLRLQLLSKFGGVWVDSTMLCRRPLDEWLPDQVAPAGFFAFSPETPEVPVMNSFLAARVAHHPLVDRWLELLQAAWKRKDTGYFTMQQLWHKIPEDLSKGMPQISAEYGVRGPHFFVHYQDTLLGECTEHNQKVIDEDRVTPMFKLTHYQVDLEARDSSECFPVLLEATLQQAASRFHHEVGAELHDRFDELSLVHKGGHVG
jgi:hypothetical protein